MPRLSEILARFLGEGPRRQQVLLLLALGILGLVLLAAGSTGGGGQRGEETGMPPGGESTQTPVTSARQTRAEEEYLAARLESMLSQVAGAGTVDVTVKLDGSSVLEYATSGSVNRRVTEETDRDGGRRMITEDGLDDQVVVIGASGGRQEAVLEREIAPRVTGVLVVAEGARDPQVRMELFKATRAALGVQPHLIEVMPRKF